MLEDLVNIAIGYEEAIDRIFDILEENLVDQTYRHEIGPDVPEEAIISSAEVISLIEREQQRPTKEEIVEITVGGVMGAESDLPLHVEQFLRQ